MTGSRSLRIAAQALLGLAALGAVGGMVSFKRYVEQSPRFCQTCHMVAPEIALWMESEHRNVRCQQCHHQTLADGLRVLEVYVSGSKPVTHAPIDVQSCARCHATHDARWPSIADSIGHRMHAGKAKLPCTTCHGREMHFEKPARSTCEGCHEGKAMGSAHEAQHCLACHNFLSKEDVIRPQRADCLRCHRGLERPVTVPVTAPMQFSCSACHRPHSGDGVTPCTDCHPQRELPALHGEHEKAACGACHAAHGWIAEKQQCFACHKNMHAHHPTEACSHCHRFASGLGKGP